MRTVNVFLPCLRLALGRWPLCDCGNLFSVLSNCQIQRVFSNKWYQSKIIFRVKDYRECNICTVNFFQVPTFSSFLISCSDPFLFSTMCRQRLAVTLSICYINIIYWIYKSELLVDHICGEKKKSFLQSVGCSIANKYTF